MNITISGLADYAEWNRVNVRERSPDDREDELGIGCDDDEEEEENEVDE